MLGDHNRGFFLNPLSGEGTGNYPDVFRMLQRPEYMFLTILSLGVRLSLLSLLRKRIYDTLQPHED